MMVEVQCKVTGIETANNCCWVYRVLINNCRSIRHKHQSQREQKSQNSHSCVAKTFRVEGVGGLTFARSYEWVSFTLFLKPDHFF